MSVLIGTGTTTFRTGVLSGVNPNPSYIWAWSCSGLVPEYYAYTPMATGSSTPMNLFGSATVANGYVAIPYDAGFPASFYNKNPSNSCGFGSPDKGQIQFIFKYGQFGGGAELFTLEGKTAGGGSDPYDSNDALGVFTKVTTANPQLNLVLGTLAGGLTTPNLDIVGGTTGTEYMVNAWWNKSATRNLVLQVDNNPPVVISGYLPPFQAPIWHQLIFGNDTDHPCGYSGRMAYVWNTWYYQMTCHVWQDFEFTTLNRANLENQDHNPTGVTWDLFGTTTAFTTNTDAQYTSPSLINNMADTGVRGLKWDVNATAAGGIVCSGLWLDQPTTVGFWLKNLPQLDNNEFIIIGSANDGVAASQQNYVARLVYFNNAGSPELYIQNGGFTNSPVINPVTGSSYWINIYAERNRTAVLRVFNTGGAAVGPATGVSVGASNRDFRAWMFGDFSNNLSQSAGTFIRIDNFCADSTNFTSPTPIWPMKPWA